MHDKLCTYYVREGKQYYRPSHDCTVCIDNGTEGTEQEAGTTRVGAACDGVRSHGHTPIPTHTYNHIHTSNTHLYPHMPTTISTHPNTQLQPYPHTHNHIHTHSHIHVNAYLVVVPTVHKQQGINMWVSL